MKSHSQVHPNTSQLIHISLAPISYEIRYVQGKNYFADGSAGYLAATTLPLQSAGTVEGFVIAYRQNSLGKAVFMGLGWQRHPQPRNEGDIADIEIYVTMITRGSLRVFCQIGFPSYILENLGNAHNIPGFFAYWRFAAAQNVLGWTLQGFEHNTTHSLYCITEDGILSHAYEFQAHASCVLPTDTVGGIDPICGESHGPPTHLLRWGTYYSCTP